MKRKFINDHTDINAIFAEVKIFPYSTKKKKGLSGVTLDLLINYDFFHGLNCMWHAPESKLLLSIDADPRLLNSGP